MKSSLYYPKPKRGWTCFHCGERFTTVGSARDHFGATQASMAACVIKAGDERGLVMELRKSEERVDHFQRRAVEAEDRVEVLEGELADYQRASGCRSSHELRMMLDSLNGRVVTANAVISGFQERAPEIFAEVIG